MEVIAEEETERNTLETIDEENNDELNDGISNDGKLCINKARVVIYVVWDTIQIEEWIQSQFSTMLYYIYIYIFNVWVCFHMSVRSTVYISWFSHIFYLFR